MFVSFRSLARSYTSLYLLALLAGCTNEPGEAPERGATADASPAQESGTPALDAALARFDAALRDTGSADDAHSSAPADGGLGPLDAHGSEGDASDPIDGAGSNSASDGGSQDAGDASLVCSALELCNGRDDDCNGEVDERCRKIPFNLYDFDVRADASRVAVGVENGRVRMMCFGPDGTVTRAPFEVGGPESGHVRGDGTPATVSDIEVAWSRVQGNIVVTYGYWNWPGTPYDWRVYAAFYDRDCALLKAPVRLDGDIPVPSGGVIARAPSASMADDGRAYLIYEHQTAQLYRVLMFDTAGTRSKAIDIPNANGCAGGALNRTLALDATSGKFAVVCEGSGGSRIYRRYAADGTAVDGAFVTIAGATPTRPFFHYFGAAYNAAGTLLYFGRDAPNHWILRVIAADGSVGTPPGIDGASGVVDPKGRVTSQGAFLVEIAGSTYGLALVSAAGEVQRTWPAESAGFELDAADHVYISNRLDVYRSPNITVR